MVVDNNFWRTGCQQLTQLPFLGLDLLDTLYEEGLPLFVQKEIRSDGKDLLRRRQVL